MIELIAAKPRDATRQMAYFMIDEYDFTDGSIPIALNTDVKVLIWLQEREDYYMFLILQKMYRDGETFPDWPRFKTTKNTELMAMKKWIKAGHKNLISNEGEKDAHKVIKKQPWKSSHPLGIKLKAEIAKAKTIPAIKKILREMMDNF